MPEFRQIADAEFDDAYAIVCEVTEWLLGKGIVQWRRPVPMEAYASRQERGFNFGLWQDGVLAAVLSITDDRPEHWGDYLPPGRFAWLATLASRVNMKGSGLGKRAVALAEEHIRRSGLRQVCLDCYCGSRFLPPYYEQMGYRVLSRKITSQNPEFESALMTKELGADGAAP